MTADQYLASSMAEQAPDICTQPASCDQVIDPGLSTEASPRIAVYNQVQHGRGNKDNDLFLFHGYYRLTDVAFCPPHSVALKDLLKRKWTWKDREGNEVAKERDVEHWRESFKYEWAELKLEKDEEWEKENGPPRIEKKVVAAGKGRKERGEKKSVNELLKEMRLEGDKEVKVEESSEVGVHAPKDTASKNTEEMTAGEFNQLHGRERYTVVFNAADGKEVSRTKRSKNMVTTEDHKEMTAPEESKKMVMPEDSKETVMAKDTKEMITPEESKVINEPEESKKMSATEDFEEAIVSKASEEKLDPEASKIAAVADDSNEVLPAEKSEGTIATKISDDALATEDSKGPITAEDAKEAIAAEDPKVSITTTRDPKETPATVDSMGTAQEETKDE
ncbi:hypothetical protein BDZ85DRAFT_258194 [Elsinoe ampelina]|uniref:Uncharacterized protein n=1 Tax=Elsinoe ampelina TaxID=302913 RepID=A0A6A6GKE0_9PEZI|nr:hypothetical protein BDZ85DRAFT_258194 [Elsinoe ampelina]